MRLWEIGEDCEYEGLALAVATIKTPASWRAVRSRAWICHAGEAMRGLFPTLPEQLDGPWGSLPRDAVFGAEDACSALLDAMEGLTLGSGAVDKAFEQAEFEMGAHPLSERIEQGKIELAGGAIPGDFSVTSHAAWMSAKGPKALYLGDRGAALGKIDAVLDAMGAEIQRWMPCAVQLADPSVLSKGEVRAAMAMAKRAQIARASGPGRAPKGPKGRL